MKKVSVIIPCYNVEYEIDRLMECLIEQTVGVENLEIILVNDGSIDGTASKLSIWEKRYEENVILICCGQNSGLSYARNIAMDMATGDYIAFIDADDWVSLDYIGQLLGMCEKYHSDIAICRHDRVNSFNKRRNARIVYGEEYEYCIKQIDEKKQFLASHVLTTSVWGKLYNRDFIEKYHLRFPEKVCYEDTLFSYMSYMYADSVSECTAVLYHYYHNPLGIVISDSEQKKRERLVTLRMFYSQCIKHGWLDVFYDEIELIFIQKYYVEMLEVMFRTFKEVDYSVYCGIRDWLVIHFPDFSSNAYLEKSINAWDRLLLMCITEDFNEQQVNALRKSFLNIMYKSNAPSSFCKRTLSKKLFPSKEMLLSWMEIVCKNPTEDNILKMKEMLSIIPYEKTDKGLLKILESSKGRLPSEIYCYIIDCEIFIAYLNDFVKSHIGNIPPEILNICQNVINIKLM